MCGIFGLSGQPNAIDHAADALSRMSYRGYDSAGVADMRDNGFRVIRAAGRIEALRARITDAGPSGECVIGHTRWATHGAPSEYNAHPHIQRDVCLVHNGIIENYVDIRVRLAQAGYTALSDTDSEVSAMLIDHHARRLSDMESGMRAAAAEMKGSFAIAALHLDHPDRIFAIRRGSPLLLARTGAAWCVSSDQISVAPFADGIVVLEEGDLAVIGPAGVSITGGDGRRVERPVIAVEREVKDVSKSGFETFMEKEIREQPVVLARALSAPIRVDLDPARTRRILMVGCGTSYYACMVAKYWIEDLADLPVEVCLASEARYGRTPCGPDDVAIFVSQSGETADTLAALRDMARRGSRTIGIVNVPTSSIARECETLVETLARPEIGVASTKAFTCQMAALARLAAALGEKSERSDRFLAALREVPRHVASAIDLWKDATQTGLSISRASSALFIGRGPLYPIALEAALKLKELSYIHAEGYAAGELKHGPLALVDAAIPTIALLPSDCEMRAKTLSNAIEIDARSGPVHAVSAGSTGEEIAWSSLVSLRDIPADAEPFAFAVIAQIIALASAQALGCDIDQPRNLAKSVCVE